MERCAIAIDKAKAKGVALIFEIGKQLQVAHDELANHGDGAFGKWVVTRCGISKRSAYNYLNATEAFGSQKLLDCATVAQSFDAKALFYLARDTTPEEAIADALKAAKKGERITLPKAREIIAAYTVEETEDIDSDEASGDGDEDADWSSLDFDLAIRNETLRWWRMCPAPERTSIPEILRRIADKMEERLNGHSA